MLNLSVQNLVLKYPKKTVLNGISLDFNHSQIHALIGENGAGKSSLIKIICGDILPTAGKILLNQKEAAIKSPADAIKYGIVCVHQRPLLADSISIMENLMLGAASFDRKRARELLSLWLPGIDEKRLIKNCSGDIRFFTSLTGALLKNPGLLILDEPSALLNSDQRDFLFEKLKKFAAEGMNIIVITHFMEEAKKYGDTITYLEEGRVSKPKDDFLNAGLREDGFAGRETCPNHSKKTDFSLSFYNLNSLPNDKPAIRDFSFTANGGEITLISGQAEDGRETLEDTISGMSRARQKGLLKITDKITGRAFSFEIKDGNFTRRQLEKSPFTFGIIPSNKNFRGSNPELTIMQLLSSGLSEGREKALSLIKKADVNITLNEKAECLSGGMLQRLILERELEKNPDVLILCEPVQGLDSRGVKKLCRRIEEIAKSGKIVLVLSSSEFPEEICDKIYRLGKRDLQEKSL